MAVMLMPMVYSTRTRRDATKPFSCVALLQKSPCAVCIPGFSFRQADPGLVCGSGPGFAWQVVCADLTNQSLPLGMEWPRVVRDEPNDLNLK